MTQGYAPHPLPPDLTVTTSCAIRPHFLVDAIKPMVSASVDTTRTGYTGIFSLTWRIWNSLAFY